MKPPLITMQTAKHSRESAAKGDDQIAFENATALEEACSYQKALDWYDEVKPTGGYWDMSASAGRVAILVALDRAAEAVEIGQQAIQRMQKPNPELLGETARALNATGGARLAHSTTGSRMAVSNARQHLDRDPCVLQPAILRISDTRHIGTRHTLQQAEGLAREIKEVLLDDLLSVLQDMVAETCPMPSKP